MVVMIPKLSLNQMLVCFIVAVLIFIQVVDSCNSTIENTVRLNNEGVFLSSSDAGRVEICHCSDSLSCSWKTVSTGSLTSPFSWKNSIVVCRELDFFDVQSPILQNTVSDLNHAGNSVPIYETTFNCDGSENSLIDCSPGDGTGSQTHKADAYVTCQTSPTDRKVRIVGSTNPTQGIIELYTSTSGWSTVCTDFWRDIEANVFCISLGYSGGVSNSYSRTDFVNTAVDSHSSISILSCSATDTSMSGCSITFGPDCGNFLSLAGARCTASNAADGNIRLYDVSATSRFSRVEIFFGGRWGTICNAAWVEETAQIACKELGHTPSLTEIPTYTTTFSSSVSSRPIWIYGYTCAGGESELHDCNQPAFPIGFPSSSCTHSTDAGLYCETAPYQLSGGGIAGIVIASLLVVGTFITVLVLHDKHKKGELQAWYRPRRARFLTWYHQRRRQWQTFRRNHCSCCTCRRRRRSQPSSQSNATEEGVVLNPTQTPTPTTPTTTPQSQPPPPVVTSEPSGPSSEFTPTAPPSYDVAITEHQVGPPPPDYSNDKLPYPETDEYHSAAYPPPGPAGMH